MKPRSFERGKGERTATDVALSEASMKPRSFERGKAKRPQKTRPPFPCFNEGALFRARKAVSSQCFSVSRLMALQ